MKDNSINVRTHGGVFIERSDSINMYLNDIKKYPILTYDEEIKLIKKAQAGDEEAFNKLVLCNQRFVFAVAKRYAKDETLLDLVNEGNLGLMTAINKFDIETDYRFLSYAVWHIRAKITQYLMLNSTVVKKSNKAKTIFFENKIRNKYFCENGRFPTAQEIAEMFEKEYGVKIKDESCLYELKTNSINTTFDDNDSNAFENSQAFTSRTSSFNDYEKEIEKESKKNAVKIALNCLRERDRRIVELSFGINAEKAYSNQEIGEMYDMTSERIRQIILAATKKMKLALKHKEF